MEPTIELYNGHNVPKGLDVIQMAEGKTNAAKFMLANSSLPKDAHIELAKTITGVAEARLSVFGEFQSSGLVVPLRGVGVSQYEYQTHDDVTPARVGMSFPRKSENDQPKYDLTAVPIPIFSKNFSFDDRQIDASMFNADQGIDTIAAERATRVVSELMENYLLVGSEDIRINQVAATGILNFPDVNTYTIPLTWTDPGADIIQDVKNMIDIMRLDNYRSGLRLRVNDTYWTKLQCDYNDVKGDKTFLQRILDFAQIDSVEVLENSANIGTEFVYMYAANRLAIEVPVASDIRMVEYNPTPQVTEFIVWSALGIAPKVDSKGQSGILFAEV